MLQANLKDQTGRPRINDPRFIASIATEEKYCKLIESRTSFSKQEVELILHKVFQELLVQSLDVIRFVGILYKHGIPVDEAFYKQLGDRPWSPFVIHYQRLLDRWILENKSLLTFDHPIGSPIKVFDHDRARTGYIKGYNEKTLCYKVEYNDYNLDEVKNRIAMTVAVEVPVELVKDDGAV